MVKTWKSHAMEAMFRNETSSQEVWMRWFARLRVSASRTSSSILQFRPGEIISRRWVSIFSGRGIFFQWINLTKWSIQFLLILLITEIEGLNGILWYKCSSSIFILTVLANRSWIFIDWIIYKYGSTLQRWLTNGISHNHGTIF